jgi:acyl-CoA synthetase (AMP-forming)/AMP-acid ligase II/acyl carrier protein
VNHDVEFIFAAHIIAILLDTESCMPIPSSPSTEALSSCPTLSHLLRARAGLHPERLAYTYLTDGESAEENLTFAGLDQRARVLAAELRRLGLEDSRALIVYEPGLDYLVALLGCFYAKVAAVPVYPPDPMRATRTLARLQSIVSDAQPRAVLTTSALRGWADSLPVAGGSLEHVLATDIMNFDADPPWEDPGLAPDTVALLQYTSGSTSAPRGCVITHRNLLYHFQHIQHFDEPDAVAVSWLPMYHDMGLIGLALQTAHGGRRLVFMSPLSFVQRPFRWLQAISKYRAYATASPNFGYELCVRKVSDEEISQLDLSCLTLACNGAEPIRHATLAEFMRRFEPCGLRPEAFYPCYGLAEATLIVSGGDKYATPVLRSFRTAELSQGIAAAGNRKDHGAQTLVGCGKAIPGTIARIVDPQTSRRCHEGQVGEIWVQGPGVARGYWGRKEESQEVFGGYINDTGEGPFLRTGDLGFFHAGELFVVGRRKDLIILHGKNHYPQDIESTLTHCHASLRRDSGAAFSITVDDEERLVIVHEVVRPQRTDLNALLAAIRAEIIREHQISPYAIVLIKAGTLPKTSSGKIQRRECRERFLSAELDVVAEWKEAATLSAVPRPAVEANPELGHRNGSPTRAALFQTVRKLLEQVLPEPGTPIHEESRLFADLGLASIDAVALQGLVEEHYQRRFPFDEFMAELGSRQARDAQVAEFVSFLHSAFEHKVGTK